MTYSYLEELEKLSALREKGVITEEEFQEEKEKILRKSQIGESTITVEKVENKLQGKPKKGKKIILIALSIFVGLIIIASLINHQTEKSTDGGRPTQAVKEKDEPEIVKIAKATPYNISPYGELAEMFKMGSDYTDLQRENKKKELIDKIVEWNLEVYEIKRVNDNLYRVQTTSPLLFGRTVKTFTYVHTRNDLEKVHLAHLKTGDTIHIKGKIKDIDMMRTFKIDPAIVIMPVKEVESLNAPPAPKTLPNKEEKSESNLSEAKVEACVNAWVNEYRKEKGDDAVIKFDLLEEVRKDCESKNR